MADPIHIGNDHNYGSTSQAQGNRTTLHVDPSTYCTGDGTIQTCYVYWKVYSPGDVYFGAFENLGGNDFKCRDAVGPLPIGGWYLQSYSVSLAAKTNDCLGCYYTGNSEFGRNNAPDIPYMWVFAFNACVKDLVTHFANYVTDRELSFDGEGIEVSVHPLYLGGIAAAKRMAPMRGW